MCTMRDWPDLRVNLTIVVHNKKIIKMEKIINMPILQTTPSTRKTTNMCKTQMLNKMIWDTSGVWLLSPNT